MTDVSLTLTTVLGLQHGHGCISASSPSQGAIIGSSWALSEAWLSHVMVTTACVITAMVMSALVPVSTAALLGSPKGRGGVPPLF